MVPGHGIAKFWKEDLAVDESWFGIFPGDGPRLLEHIKAGVERAAANPNSILVFSGGQTRPPAGPLSEGATYWHAARAMNWFGHPEVEQRAFAEEFARDSFENLLFSVLLYHRHAARLPDLITITGWDFKEERYDFHASTLGLLSIMRYVGVNTPEDAPGNPKEAVLKGEAGVLAQFKMTPWGSKGELAAKKAKRDPFLRRGLAYYSSDVDELVRSGHMSVLDSCPLEPEVKFIL